MDLYDIVRRNALYEPDKIAVRDEGQARTYAQLAERSARVASVLTGRFGVRPGERVGIAAPNCVEYCELYFGCALAGAIVAPCSNEPAPRLASIMADSSSRLLVAHPAYEATIDAVVRDGYDGTVVMLGSGATPHLRYEALLEQALPDASPRGRPEDVVVLLYTSGTTGHAKGVMHSQRGLLACAWSDIAHGLATADDCHLAVSSLSGGGSLSRLVSILLIGGTVQLMEGFDPARIGRLLSNGELSTISSYPLMLNRLREELPAEPRRFPRLRLVTFGGAPMTEHAMAMAVERFSTGFCQLYGCTEAMFIAIQEHAERLEGKRRSSVGRERLGVTVKLVDAQGQPVRPGEVGEVLARGDTVTSGYWNHPDKTADVLEAGWLKTGDLGRIDQGDLYLVGRKKDMLMGFGFKIYPRDVESVLESHPLVAEASVVGVTLDDGLVESAVAFVRLRQACSPVEAEKRIREHCAAALMEHEMPVQFRFVDDFPRARGGKIRKDDLAARVGPAKRT